MIWKPPFSEMICRFMCFCRILHDRHEYHDARSGVADSRDQSDSHLLVENLQHFFARTTPEQLTMHLETLDRLTATFGWP